MAQQIDSVEFYLHRLSDRTGWNLQVDIHDVSAHTDNPTVGDILGSKAVSVDTVPLAASKDWVVFTFDTPIAISSEGFFAIHFWANAPSNYQAAGVYTYETDDWVNVSGEAPFTGAERKWDRDYLALWAWGGSIAYRINCTDVADNESESPTVTTHNFGAATITYGFGVRTYLIATPDLPTKTTNPAPANGATEVDFSGLVLDWDDGGGADTFDVYIGPSGNLIKVADAISPSIFTVDLTDVPKEQVIYWRVDSTNAGGTTTGDIWNFDARPAKPTTPSPADAASDITLDETPLGWVAG